jgi:hypothetical protein
MDIAGNPYFYEKAAWEAPTPGFDEKQEPTRGGARVHIKMLDGTTAAMKTWGNINGQWGLTELGKHFYKDSTHTYLVTFPVLGRLLRNNGTEWKVDTVLKSTATSLGEIKLPVTMPEAEQIAEVKRRTLAYIASLPKDDAGDAIMIQGEGSEPTAALDDARGLQYNKEEILAQPEGGVSISAVMHRPLRAAKP